MLKKAAELITSGFGGDEEYFKEILANTKKSISGSNITVGEYMLSLIHIFCTSTIWLTLFRRTPSRRENQPLLIPPRKDGLLR